MNQMTKRIFTGWSFWRFVRLALGLYILADGIMSGMWGFAGVGLIFTLLPLFNLGCSGGNCAVDSDVSRDLSTEEDIIYEEVK